MTRIRSGRGRGTLNTMGTRGRMRRACANPSATGASGDDPSVPVPSIRASLPFDGRRWLGADVVHDSIYARDLVDDPRRDASEHVVRELRPVGGHAVLRGHGADGDDVRVCPVVAHDAD